MATKKNTTTVSNDQARPPEIPVIPAHVHGDKVTLLLPALSAVLENDQKMRLPANPTVPLIDVNWADERIFCGHLRREDSEGAQACSELRRDDGCHWCALNGSTAKTPCAFAEPEESEIWQWLRGYKKECEERGWPLCAE